MRATEFIIEDELDEGWKDTLAHLGMIGLLAGAGTMGMTAKQAINDPSVPDVKKAAIAIKADIPSQQLPQHVASKIPDAKSLLSSISSQNANQSTSYNQDLKNLTKPVLAQKFNIKPITDNPNELKLKRYAMSQGINGIELAAFLSQCAVETGNFENLVEIASGKDYEPIFKKDKNGKIIIDPTTKKFKNFNPVASRLGNTERGDGPKFKGRGFIQLTGRDNYRMASLAVFKDLRLLENPKMAEDPDVAMKIAVWYWQNRVKPNVTNFNDVRAVTYPINSGFSHLDRREKAFSAYMNLAQGRDRLSRG